MLSDERGFPLLGCAAVLACTMMAAAASAETITIGFEDLTLSGSNTFFDGGASSAPWKSGGATFNNAYADFGGGSGSWYGWAYSNVDDTTDGTWENQYAAWPGTGVGGAGIYGVVFDDGYSGATNVAHVDLPDGYRPQSIMLANTTYAALTMKNGDDYGFCQAFKDGDFFSVTFTGWDGVGASGSTTGWATFQLATGDQIATGWNLLDLASLADGTRSLSLSFAGSQGGAVPAYVAIDDLKIVTVPEPSALVLAVVGWAVAVVRARCATQRRTADER